MEKEKILWQGSPSQIANLGFYVVSILFFWLIFPIFLSIWYWLVVKNTQYTLTTERLSTRYGVINKYNDELELYRVRDYHVQQPLLLRPFSLSNLLMPTSDRSHPQFKIEAVEDGERLRNVIRDQVEVCRVAKRVREVDFE